MGRYEKNAISAQTERSTLTSPRKKRDAHLGRQCHRPSKPLSARKFHVRERGGEILAKRLRRQIYSENVVVEPREEKTNIKNCNYEQRMLAWGGKTIAQPTIPYSTHVAGRREDCIRQENNLGKYFSTSFVSVAGENSGSSSKVKAQGSSNAENSGDRRSIITWTNLCMTPSEAIQRHFSKLTDFEKSEILQYEEIWFLGCNAKQKIEHRRKTADFRRTENAMKVKADDTRLVSNTAVDPIYHNERGDYNVQIGDHIAYRYEVLEILGKGTFGQVVRCRDHKARREIALKIIRNKKRFYQQGCIEVKILSHCASQCAVTPSQIRTTKVIGDCSKIDEKSRTTKIISILNSFLWRGHLVIAFPVLSINLYEMIKRRSFRGIAADTVRSFVRQIVTGLYFLKKKSIIHCDLKPENILLCEKGKSDIRIIDLGSSCFANERSFTYIQSRFYRAPEVILGIPYTCAIDMWSLGCLIVELLTGSPIFPGDNEIDLLHRIIEVCGEVPKSVLQRSPRRRLFYNGNYSPKVDVMEGRIRQPSSRSILSVVGSIDESLLSFIEACLIIDPEQRQTPEEALQHKWLTPSKNLHAAKFMEDEMRSQPHELMFTAPVVSSGTRKKLGRFRPQHTRRIKSLKGELP